MSRTLKTNGSADRVQAIGASVGIRMTSTEATIRSDKIMALFSRSLWSGMITFTELYGHVLVDEIPDLCAKRRQLHLNLNTRDQVVDKLYLACSAESGWQPHEMLQRRSRCTHLQTLCLTSVKTVTSRVHIHIYIYIKADSRAHRLIMSRAAGVFELCRESKNAAMWSGCSFHHQRT